MIQSVLVDSSVWIETLRDPEAASSNELRQLISDSRAYTTGVVRAEILPFVRAGKEAQTASILFAAVPSIDVDATDIWQRVTEWRTRFVRSGLSGIALPDVIVATVALERDLALWSFDKHFDPISARFPLRRYSFDPQR